MEYIEGIRRPVFVCVPGLLPCLPGHMVVRQVTGLLGRRTEYTTVHCCTLQYTAEHYSTLQYTTVHYSTLQYTTVHYSTLQYTTSHYNTLHYTTLGKLVVWGPVGEKWEDRKKVGDLPLFSIPSPVQPPLALMFDISIFSYQNLNV